MRPAAAKTTIAMMSLFIKVFLLLFGDDRFRLRRRRAAANAGVAFRARFQADAGVAVEAREQAPCQYATGRSSGFSGVIVRRV